MSRNRKPLRPYETLDYDSNNNFFYIKRQEGRTGRKYNFRSAESLLITRPNMILTKSAEEKLAGYNSKKEKSLEYSSKLESAVE